jgi:hypothetical protein
MTTVTVPIPASQVQAPEQAVPVPASIVEAPAQMVTVPASSVQYTIQLSDAIATVEAAGGVVTMPSTPPPVTPPPPGLPTTALGGAVFVNGTNYWVGNYNYGGIVQNLADTSMGPSYGKDILLTNSGSGGGYQPYVAANQFFDTTNQEFLYLQLQSALANQAWIMNVAGVGDVVVGTPRLDPSQYRYATATLGPNPKITAVGAGWTPGVWNLYKIPVHNGGFALSATQVIIKFSVQDESGATGTRWAAQQTYWSGS